MTEDPKQILDEGVSRADVSPEPEEIDAMPATDADPEKYGPGE